jgi:hypothetical protein
MVVSSEVGIQFPNFFASPYDVSLVSRVIFGVGLPLGPCAYAAV